MGHKLGHCLYSYYFQHSFRTCFGKVLLGESIPPELQDRIFGRVLDSLLKLLWTNLLELATMFRAIIWEPANSFFIIALYGTFLGFKQVVLTTFGVQEVGIFGLASVKCLDLATSKRWIG